MKTRSILVPGGLLLDQSLTASTKLVWMVWQMCAREAPLSRASPAVLEARSGLSRKTILRALAQLRAAGWLCPAACAGPTEATVRIPDDLLVDQRLSATAKVVYGILQLAPGFWAGKGEFMHQELAPFAGLHPVTLTAALRLLRVTGWIQTAQASKVHPVHVELRNPVADRRHAEVSRAQLRLAESDYRGEAIMRECLTLLIDSDEYDDNASPAFLLNPFTGEEMEFDRYYPPRVAFEFNGPQHYGATERFPSEEAAWKQQGRDLLKAGICATRGITLVVVLPEELSLKGLARKIEGLLPLRDPAGHEPLVEYLEAACAAYRRNARKWHRANSE